MINQHDLGTKHSCARQKNIRASLRFAVITKRLDPDCSKGTRSDATKRVWMSRGDDDLSHRAFERAFARLGVGVLLRELGVREVIAFVVGVGVCVGGVITRKRIHRGVFGFIARVCGFPFAGHSECGVAVGFAEAGHLERTGLRFFDLVVHALGVVHERALAKDDAKGRGFVRVAAHDGLERSGRARAAGGSGGAGALGGGSERRGANVGAERGKTEALHHGVVLGHALGALALVRCEALRGRT